MPDWIDEVIQDLQSLPDGTVDRFDDNVIVVTPDEIREAIVNHLPDGSEE